jgi:hypothetical protein
MVTSARTELAAAGVTAKPGMTRADAGYWNHEHMDDLAADAIPVLIPPDAVNRKSKRPG